MSTIEDDTDESTNSSLVAQSSPRLKPRSGGKKKKKRAAKSTTQDTVAETWALSLNNFEERQTHVLKSRKAAACNEFPEAAEAPVRRLEKKRVVVLPGNMGELDLYVQYCFKFWAASWVFVDRPFAAYKPAELIPLGLSLVYASDLDRTNLAGESLARKLIPISAEMDSREPVFDYVPLGTTFSFLYNPQWDWGRGMAYSQADRNFTRLGDPNTTKVFQQPEAIQFVVSPGPVELAVGNYEPLFCSLTLYHINSKEKMSETFHYSVDTSGHLDLVRNVEGPDLQGDMLNEERCIFSVATPSKYVHLVLTVYRLLQGDEEKSAEPYLLDGEKSGLSATLRIPFQNSLRKLNKIKEHTPIFCNRLGAYRQAFAFAAMPVFDNDGRFSLTDGAFSSFYLMQPGEDFSVCDLLLQQNLRRLKPVAATCSLSARRIVSKDLEGRRLDSALVPYPGNEGVSATRGGGGIEYLRDAFDLTPSSKVIPFTSFISTLFLYPLAASLQMDRKKSIAVRLEFRSSDDDKVTVPLKALFSSTGAVRRILTDTARTSVVFGDKNPTWAYEEIRVHLPARLTEKHHIMCFFSEIDVEAVRKQIKGVETEQLLGVSIIRLLDKKSGALLDANGAGTRLSLPIFSCESPLPRGYLALVDENKLPCLDGGKDLFQMQIRGFSSTLSSNRSVATMMKLLSAESQVGTTEPSEGKERNLPLLLATLEELRHVNLELVLPHFPTLAGMLLLLMTRCTDCAQQTFQTLVIMLYRIHLSDKRPLEKRTGVIHHFIEYVLEPMGDGKVYHAIVTQWVTLAILVKKGVVEDEMITSELLCSVSWMLFDSVYKLLVLTPRDESLPRIQQFSPDFPRVFKKLLLELRLLLWSIIENSGAAGQRSAVEEVGGVNLNINMAMFLSDLLTVYDRGLVVDAVVQHIDESWAQIALKRQGGLDAEATLMSLLLLDFIKILYDNEHFVQLNIPKPLVLSPSMIADVLETIEEKHPLPGKLSAIVVQELINPKATLESRGLALSVMANLITKIDRDARFQASQDRHRIAIMFLPLLLRVMQAWKLMEPWRAVSDTARLYERQELGASLVWILGCLDSTWLRTWWKLIGADGTFASLGPLLQDLLQVFCRDKEAANLATPFGTTSANVDSLMDIDKHGVAAAFKLRTRLGLRTDSSVSSFSAAAAGDGSATVSGPSSSSPSSSSSWSRFKLLSHHVSSLVLSVVDNLISDFPDSVWAKVPSSSTAIAIEAPPIALQSARILQVVLESTLSINVVPSVFLVLQRFVHGQGTALFRTTLKAEASRIISAVLHLCSSVSPKVRSEASAFLYFLILENVQHLGSFDVVKNASVLACSRLAEDDKVFGGAAFQSSLDRIAEYALDDLYSPKRGDFDDDDKVALGRTVFVKQVQELCRALAAIVQDTQKIVSSRGSSDVEMVAEQYFRMAEGYRYSPELRLEWLEKLAQFHATNGDFPEAAIAMTHVLALLADYLNSCTDIKIATDVFKSINPAIAEFYSEEASAGGSSSFCLRHTKFVAKAVIRFLGQGELYEMAAEVYRLLLGIYHSQGSFRDLTNAHTELEGFYNKLSKTDTDRLLGRYYRVGFYGAMFGPELDGAEFIYKEPLLTHLFALKDRLTSHFGTLFGGDDKVEVLDHGGMVDITQLNVANKAYLQITALRPVWSDDESPVRQTFFQKNTRLSSFAFETPFSKGGKIGQTTTAEQWMRRTILTAENSFPYVLKRNLVRSRAEVVLSPIEIAVEMMQARIEKLQLEVSRNPPDSKTLQQVLQGSVLTTVNRGTIEYLEIFLVHASDFPAHHVLALQEKFRGFFKVALEALDVNQSIIDGSQQEFQQEMMNGYRELCKFAHPMLALGSSSSDNIVPGDDSGGNSSGASPRPTVSGAFLSPRSYMPPAVLSHSPANSPKLRRRTKKSGSQGASPRNSNSEINIPEDLSVSQPTGIPEPLLKTAHRLSVRRASLKPKKTASRPTSPRGSAPNSPRGSRPSSPRNQE